MNHLDISTLFQKATNIFSKKERQLTFQTMDSADVPENLIKQMWKLRLQFYKLKDDSYLDKNWKDFHAYFQRKNRSAVMFLDHENKLQGFSVISYDPLKHKGKKAVLITIEYSYLQKAYRGHPVFVASCFYLLPSVLFKFGLRSLYFVAFTFPNSYAFINSTFGKVWTLQEKETPSWERYALEWFAKRAAGKKWNKKKKLVYYKDNVPPKSPNLKRMPDRIRELHEKYESLNPHWHDGAVMPMIVGMNRKTLGHAIKRTILRIKREKVS